MPLKILFIESDQLEEYNCSNWRCVMPARALLRAGHHARVLRLENFAGRMPEADKLMREADLVFYQRNVFHDIVHTIFQWKAQGSRIVVDLDDAYEHMTEETGSPSFNFWKHGKATQPDGHEGTLDPLPMVVLRHGVKICGSLTSPSKLICEDWRKYSKPYWFPNYVDISLFDTAPTYRMPGRIHLGWGGSMTHLVSWTGSGAVEAVTQLINEQKDRINIVLFGDPRTERFFKIPKPNRLVAGWIPQANFAAKLSHIDIGLIPLYGEYDRRRSWIKTAEFGVMGIPWIGSDMEPTWDAKGGCRVENTAEAWYDALKFHVDHYADVKEAAERSVEENRHFFSIDENVGHLIKLCEQIIEGYE